MEKNYLEKKVLLRKRWEGIKQRCFNKNASSYKYYGAKGISVCKEWKNDFDAFYTDMAEGFNPNLHIDRINPFDDYSKKNCRWISPSENSKRVHKEKKIYFIKKEFKKQKEIRGKTFNIRDDLIHHLYRVGFKKKQIAYIFNTSIKEITKSLKNQPVGFKCLWIKTS